MKVSDIDPLDHRDDPHDVDPLFLRRWSPRAMSGEALDEDELMRLFAAAGWAPSSYNGQPWRFLYAHRDTEEWDRFYDLLGEWNRGWCDDAAVLVVILSRDTFERNGKPAKTHSFDAGAAWMSLALQGSLAGLVVHGMQGFDYERAKSELGVPDGHTVEAMCAIGRPGDVDDLAEQYREKEKPSGRKEVSEYAFEGPFPD